MDRVGIDACSHFLAVKFGMPRGAQPPSPPPRRRRGGGVGPHNPPTHLSSSAYDVDTLVLAEPRYLPSLPCHCVFLHASCPSTVSSSLCHVIQPLVTVTLGVSFPGALFPKRGPPNCLFLGGMADRDPPSESPCILTGQQLPPHPSAMRGVVAHLRGTDRRSAACHTYRSWHVLPRCTGADA